MNELVPTLVTPATKSSMYASESLGVTAFKSSVGFTTPVNCPLESTWIECRKSKSNDNPMMSPAVTVKGLLNVIATDDCVSVTAGAVVPFNVATTGRVGGFVCGFGTLRYAISGFANVTFTVVYVPAGIEFRSSKVCNPFNRAKSTVCVPFNTDTGGFIPSDTVL